MRSCDRGRIGALAGDPVCLHRGRCERRKGAYGPLDGMSVRLGEQIDHLGCCSAPASSICTFPPSCLSRVAILEFGDVM
ncbi:hypothetical protein D3C85_1675600 [compost metagenome]